MFKCAMFDNIICHLPAKPLYRNENPMEGLDFDLLSDFIIKKNQMDEIFLTKFLQTQMFAAFLESFYDL